MDLITLIAVIFIIIGAVLLVAGYLAPGVPPGAVSAGWGLLAFGVILLVIALVVSEADLNDDRGAVFGPLGLLWAKLQSRSVSRGRAASRVPPRP